MAENNSWSQYEKLVLNKLDNERFVDIEQKLTQIQVDIATLKVKATVWGGIGGLIPVVVAMVMFYVATSK